MKYFPSAVHLPQHSSGPPCHPASKRCSFSPPIDTSQISCWPRLPAVSEVLNRKWLLSGQYVTFLISPFMLSSFRDSVPSAFARNKSLTWPYARVFPSGDKAAVSPVVSPSLCGEPPKIGILQSGPRGGAPCPFTARISEPSGDRSTGTMFAEGRIAILLGSPPEIDISANPCGPEFPEPPRAR